MLYRNNPRPGQAANERAFLDSLRSRKVAGEVLLRDSPGTGQEADGTVTKRQPKVRAGRTID